MEIRCDFDPAVLGEAELARQRREPLLACYQQFLGHDLPNRLLSVQALAREVLTEVGPTLDADTRALLKRLAELTFQADAESRRLAALGRWCHDAGAAAAMPLSELADEAADEVKRLFPGRLVEYHVEEAMPNVLAPPRAARQALVELLCNAAQTAGPGRPVRVRVTAVAEGDGIACHVADDGPGISPERLRCLAEVLAGRLDAAEGYGLFLVRQLAVLWGGGVRLRSEAGQGVTATLLFRLPAPLPAEPGRIPSADARAAP